MAKRRLFRKRGLSLKDRFWDCVDKTGDCWVWIAGKHSAGYGVIRVDGKTKCAHRLSCEWHHGKAPRGKNVVMHSCDNPSCVNPAHLRWGTQQDNIADAIAKGRMDNSGENHGAHKLTDNDVMRLLAELPRRSQRSVARQFGVSQQYVSKLYRNGGR